MYNVFYLLYNTYTVNLIKLYISTLFLPSKITYCQDKVLVSIVGKVLVSFFLTLHI